MNRKAFCMLLLSLSALLAFSVARTDITYPFTSPELSMESTKHADAAPNLMPCGDPIDTPGYPACNLVVPQGKAEI